MGVAKGKGGPQFFQNIGFVYMMSIWAKNTRENPKFFWH